MVEEEVEEEILGEWNSIAVEDPETIAALTRRTRIHILGLKGNFNNSYTFNTTI